MDRVSKGILEHGSLDKYVESLENEIYNLKEGRLKRRREENKEYIQKSGKSIASIYIYIYIGHIKTELKKDSLSLKYL